ncbi:hypothetical protein NLG97_g1449 [Lecanicillium saksenae]|uniref:Uncharacterized protein n=1 Tax=Lecanicillium saksenae TaxID=468837 RepID=A0ACC1R3X7_9HYPO|nr:hypothetical protein NLG97_g1449 [Lecanicillium saksenae]
MVCASIAFIGVFILTFTGIGLPYSDTAVSVDGGSMAQKSTIPNLAHFVYVVADPEGKINFRFSDFVSVFSALHFWKPDEILLHTNASDTMLDAARQGKSGKWSRLLLTLPNLSVISAAVPTHAGNGKKIENTEHASDFVRVEAVRQFGGIYVDFDVFALRDLRVLRESAFHAICGRQIDGTINSGTFLSAKGSKLINHWAEEMHRVYDGGWIMHGNDVATGLANRLVAEPGEMLIMERQAFAPVGWTREEATRLFEVHGETDANVPQEWLEDSMTLEDDSPNATSYDWATSWSSTYLLHAFTPGRFGATPK